MTIPRLSRALPTGLASLTLLTLPLAAEEPCCKDSAETTQTLAFSGLTGDWGGLRSSLQERGFDFAGSYIAETFGNPKGGIKRSMVFDGLLKLSLDVNLEKAAGWQGTAFRISGLYPHGTSGSDGKVGDAAIFSNIDSYDTYRLVDFWVEQKFLDGKLGLKVGQMRVDDEFGVTDTASLFINSTFGIPNPAATPMPLGIYPIGSLGIRLKAEPLEGLYALAGIYDGNPSPSDFADPTDGTRANGARHGTDWAMRKSEGTLYTGELGYQRPNGPYPGAIRFGFLRHSDDFADTSPTPGANHSSSTAYYYVLDQTLWQKSKESKEGLSAFLRGTMAPKGSSTMDETTQVGVVYTGLMESTDSLGLAWAHNRFSPNSNNQDRENIAELTYSFAVTPYLRVQPDIQYINHPGGTTVHNNAWVLGIRASVNF
jgi:porin